MFVDQGDVPLARIENRAEAIIIVKMFSKKLRSRK
jgi:hypothetical protein